LGSWWRKGVPLADTNGAGGDLDLGCSWVPFYKTPNVGKGNQASYFDKMVKVEKKGGRNGSSAWGVLGTILSINAEKPKAGLRKKEIFQPRPQK